MGTSRLGPEASIQSSVMASYGSAGCIEGAWSWWFTYNIHGTE